MINLINEFLNSGDAVTIYFSIKSEPLRAQFVKAADSALLLRTSYGHSIVNINSISRIEIPAKQQNIYTPATPASAPIAASTPDSMATDTAITSTKDYQTDAEDAADTETDGETFSPVFTPKVVGHIDLNSINDPRRKRPYNIGETPSIDNPMIPAGGTVASVGPAFGFITATNGESLFFSRNEVMQRRPNEPIYKGMPVIFTPGRNDKGGVARCVHSQLTMHEQLEWIERIEKYDRHNAKMLANQLVMAFPDDAELADTLSSINVRLSRQPDTYSRIGVPVAEQVLTAVEHGHYVEPQELLKAAQEIVASRAYEDAFALLNSMLEYSMANNRPVCYQLFLRMVKLARNNADTDRALATLDRAIEFYAEESGSRAYFQDMRNKTIAAADGTADTDNLQPVSESGSDTTDPINAAATKIMTSIKSSVGLISDSPEIADKAIDKVSEIISEDNACVCGRIDVAAIEIDDKFENRFFYATLCALSDALAKKFDTDFEKPAIEEFINPDVSEFNAMQKLIQCVRTLRAAITSGNAAYHNNKLHVVLAVANFNVLSKLTLDGAIGDSFFRHLNGVIESPASGTSSDKANLMQLVLAADNSATITIKDYTAYSL